MKVFIAQSESGYEEKDLWRKDVTLLMPHLNARDLRPVFLPRQVATILPRGGEVAIVNLGFIKCLLARDKGYFFVHRNEERIITLIEKIQNRDDGETPFFLSVLEKILEEKTLQISTDIRSAEKETNAILARIKKSFQESDIEKLLSAKKMISKLEAGLREITGALTDIIDDDDTFTSLTEITADNKKTAEELASILENAIEQVEELSGHVYQLSEDVEDTEDFLTLKLNARRTATIRADLMATIVTLIFSLLAVVVGLYGVNIRNGFEENPDAFLLLKLGLIAFFIVSFLISFLYLRKKGLF